MSDERRAPRRLVQTLGPAGDCLREVLAQQEQVLPPRFALLQERRARRVRRQRALLLSALALIGGHALRREDAQPNIRAELVTSVSPRPSPVAGAAALPQVLFAPATASEAVVARAAVSAVVPSKSAAPRLARSAEAEQAPVGIQATDRHEVVARGSAKACAQLARDGAAEQALACYQALANGGGITAELALFEQARLEGKVLRRPERALLTLNDYRQRFPNGSLRGEVMLAQIDWLLAVGDSARARQVVDEALGSALLRERTAELEGLRATLSAVPAP